MPSKHNHHHHNHQQQQQQQHLYRSTTKHQLHSLILRITFDSSWRVTRTKFEILFWGSFLALALPAHLRGKREQSWKKGKKINPQATRGSPARRRDGKEWRERGGRKQGNNKEESACVFFLWWNQKSFFVSKPCLATEFGKDMEVIGGRKEGRTDGRKEGRGERKPDLSVSYL